MQRPLQGAEGGTTHNFPVESITHPEAHESQSLAALGQVKQLVSWQAWQDLGAGESTYLNFYPHVGTHCPFFKYWDPQSKQVLPAALHDTQLGKVVEQATHAAPFQKNPLSQVVQVVPEVQEAQLLRHVAQMPPLFQFLAGQLVLSQFPLYKTWVASHPSQTVKLATHTAQLVTVQGISSQIDPFH